MDLGAFLVGANLIEHGEGLAALGCKEVDDLQELTDDECVGVGMKPVEIRRMRRNAWRWRGAIDGKAWALMSCSSRNYMEVLCRPSMSFVGVRIVSHTVHVLIESPVTHIPTIKSPFPW
eukprot:COSAG01_NODE_868_length_13035_cov_4.786024_17_plen_119_part_00